jgi:hypothetical protein
MSWFGRKDKGMTFQEELEVAVRWCTMRSFASLSSDEQYIGYEALGEELLKVAAEMKGNA